VAFYVVYIQEAHPSDGWVMRNNVQAGITVATPLKFGARIDVAKTCAANLKLPMSTLVDTMDNAVNYKYSAWPDRIYVVDAKGRIAVQAAHGPRGFKPGVEATAAWLAENVSGK
jgi:hypothetical protein